MSIRETVYVELPLPPSVSDLELLALHKQLGTLDAVAAKTGMNRATIHRRIKKAGFVSTYNSPITDGERRVIRAYYEQTPVELFSLNALSKQLGRTPQLISRAAGEMGLTSYRRPKSREARENLTKGAQGKWKTRTHPRGYSGHQHSEEAKKVIGESSRRSWATQKAFGVGNMSDSNRQTVSDRMSKLANARSSESAYSRCKYGRRADIGEMFFRSAWEANVARYLNILVSLNVVSKWEYEADTFWFLDIKRGVRSYKPDFKVFYSGSTTPTFIEVKGWMDAKSRTKLRRMAKYYPDVRIELIDQKAYNGIAAKWRSSIPGWE